MSVEPQILPNTIFAVLRAPGPAWDKNLPMRTQAGWDRHAEFMDNLTASGFVMMGGPLTNSGQLTSGEETLLIVVAENEQQVRTTLQRDPWESAGILITQHIKPWTVLLDSRKK